ncbi:MAG: type II toxin-antitoxin system VapC family toxin [bacterium]
MINNLILGEHIFIDANIYIYHYNGISLECRDLFLLLEKRKVKAFSSTLVMSEALHRMLIAECASKHAISEKQALSYLKKHPNEVKEYSNAHKYISEVTKTIVTVLDHPWLELSQTQILMQQTHGMLTNDSFHIASMKLAGITTLISADKDFDQVKEIRRIGPTDI